MNWGEFKKNIINLGFEEQEVFEENPEHVIQATNRALTLLTSIVEPKEKVYKLINNSDEYISLDLTSIVDYSSKSFKTPKQQNNPIADFFYEEDTIYINAKGEISVFYNAIPTKITTSTLDDEIIDTKDKIIPFLELLTAYYIWLDDDERKAVMYYNQFQELLQGYSTYSDSPKARIIGGVNIWTYQLQYPLLQKNIQTSRE